jgi:hypothetical protein
MTYAAATVAETVDKLNREYFLPAIQRPFVWKPEQVVALFDSLMKRYPISSFLFWAVAPENKPNWQVYKFAEHFRFGEIHTEAAETDGRKVTLVLDGQQRLTSLLLGLRGTLSIKAKHKRWDDSAAWQRRRLYLDLLVEPTVERSDSGDRDDIETPYGFHLFEAAPRSETGQLWMKVGDVLNYPDAERFSKYVDSLIARLEGPTVREQAIRARANLDRLWQVIWKDEIICYFTEFEQDYDRVLSIFVRANDGGTKLNKSDLMMSMIASKWTDISAKEEVYSFVAMLNGRLDRKNNISNDFVMKSCLLLSDIDHSYKVSNFTNHNLEIMRRNWDAIKVALKRTVLLVNRFGIDRETLTSLNTLLPIAYYLRQIDIDLTEGMSAFNIENGERIRRWLVSALLTGAFGGNSDFAIGIAKETISTALRDSKNFPIADLYENLSRQRKRPTFISDEFIEDLLQLKYGNKSAFLVLSLLYEDKNWGAIPHDIDHVIPQVSVNRRTLMARNIPNSKIEQLIAASNKIGNLQLLSSSENIKKSGRDFDEWALSMDETYYARHLIPKDKHLWDVLMLPEFVREREQLIRCKLRSLRGDVISAINGVQNESYQ